MKRPIIAHVKQNNDGSWAEPHLLQEHLTQTAELARGFAGKFNSAEWGEILGLSHDQGKGRSAWQSYLHKKSGYDHNAHLEQLPGRVVHAIHGAKIVEELYGQAVGRLLGYCVAGHHGGLPDWSGAMGAGSGSLEFRLAHVEDIVQVCEEFINPLKRKMNLKPPWKFDSGLDLSLWIRMLFSCLVDADFLDTENYMDPTRGVARKGFCTIAALKQRFETYYSELTAGAVQSPVNVLRNRIKDNCVMAGRMPQGIFALSVPTGGGKTLASLAFALEHAEEHSLERIIYVIPYTSIIEQNAGVFRKVLGDEQVVEHHSNLDEDGSSWRSRLAAENWDASMIVTTSVQFFESLFAARPSRCRKLHNIVGSVVILDEAQLLPVDYLDPILETMQLLVDRYNVTFVICTATQPALSERQVGDTLFKGLKDVREIMGTADEVQKLHQEFTRVRMSLPDDFTTPVEWEELAGQLTDYDQVLCIVSDRKSCRELHSLMPEGTYHLSALMCGQHRAEMIKKIKEDLKAGKEVRVISTQLVEAGVDFDFPVVYRALAGLDSLAQAAGRCNREGRLEEGGRVVVFVPPKRPPSGLLRKAADTTRNLLSSHNVSSDPLAPGNFLRFFEELYWKAPSLDEKGIRDLLGPRPPDAAMYFRTAATKFKLVENDQKTILVPFKEGEYLIDKLRASGPERQLLRKLQRYSVNVYSRDFNNLRHKGAIEELHPNIWVVVFREQYSNITGLLVDEIPSDPDDYIM